MKTIQLTQGEYTQVNDSDYEYLNQFSWHVYKSGSGANKYARRSIKVDGKYKTIVMHKEIIKPPKGMVTDHRDHNGLNNQRYNLRTCTNQQNLLNRISKVGSSSKYLCVIFNKRSGMWDSRITKNGKSKHIGSFKTELEAGIISNIAMRKHYGEYANPNELESILTELERK